MIQPAEASLDSLLFHARLSFVPSLVFLSFRVLDLFEIDVASYNWFRRPLQGMCVFMSEWNERSVIYIYKSPLSVVTSNNLGGA